MSPFYAIYKMREATKAELQCATSPIVRSALELQLQALTRRENSIRVGISLARGYTVHTPAPTRCAFNFPTAPILASSDHWSFDEAEAARVKAVNRTHERLNKLFGDCPRPLALAIHQLGGVRKALQNLGIEVFLDLPEPARRSAGARILSTIHQKILK